MLLNETPFRKYYDAKIYVYDIHKNIKLQFLYFRIQALLQENKNDKLIFFNILEKLCDFLNLRFLNMRYGDFSFY